MTDTCGGSNENCCTSLLVKGGTFPMGRSETTGASDYFPSGGANELPEHLATVSSFYLDKFEVTMGRFRKFLEQYPGNMPAVGAGAIPGKPGSGWQAGWPVVPKADLITALKNDTYAIWTDLPSSSETRPVTMVTWYEAFAFCLWDGGRLPTEAEWEYAAAGGGLNRLYPWGNASPDGRASFHCKGDGSVAGNCNKTDIRPVGSFSMGSGFYGHLDLAGNVWEWAFDDYDAGYYATGPCNNCVNLTSTGNKVFRGGSWVDTSALLRGVFRNQVLPTVRASNGGIRCLRSP
jgi:formylglycine-generating enzyme required for sulfatase activity